VPPPKAQEVAASANGTEFRLSVSKAAGLVPPSRGVWSDRFRLFDFFLVQNLQPVSRDYSLLTQETCGTVDGRSADASQWACVVGAGRGRAATGRTTAMAGASAAPRDPTRAAVNKLYERSAQR
jgi:hypothetical protein